MKPVTTVATRQSGAALLAFVLILVIGASYLLIRKLNDYSTIAQDTKTQIALQEAKRALLSYAMNYPELRNSTEKGPGFLPCPAQNDTGDPASGCAVSTGTTLDRLPYKILGLKDIRESGGELLWYAVSDNLKNTMPNDTVLNSETPGLISVDGANDIVAVIMAPGEPVTGQNSRPGIDKTDYLEGANADNDASAFTTSGAGEFNDQLVTISRQELMAVVEQRVINEVRAVLENYRNQYGAYPWSRAFADPKADSLRLTGTHSGGNNAPSLTDVDRNFQLMGVQVSDMVQNITDGSVGRVNGVSTNNLTFAWLQSGSENDFDTDDAYVIHKNVTGTAAAGSGGTTLVDTALDFEELGVSAGDILENTTDGSSGLIDSVATTVITVSALSGGAVNSFTPGDGYRIRSNTGRATAGSSSMTLVDAAGNFSQMGVAPADLIVNVSDGSMGIVSSVDADDTLTVEALNFGTNDSFSPNDYYYLPRYQTDGVSREGLLSFHEPGKHFKTAFAMDWDITQVNGATVVANTPGTQPVYDAALNAYAETSSGTTGTVNVDSDNATCLWVAEQVAVCKGIYDDGNIPVTGNVTSGSNTSVLTDANARFNVFGVKRGDIVQNYDDQSGGVTITADTGTGGTTLVDANIVSNLNIIPYQHVINTGPGCETGVQGLITEIIDNDTVTVQSFAGNPAIVLNAGDNYVVCTTQGLVVTGVTSDTQLNTAKLSPANPDFDAAANEFYGIKVASDLTTGTATLLSSGNLLVDSSADFINAGIQAGDVVENITDGSFGRITAVTGITLSATLYGGSDDSFQAGDQYRVSHGYVTERRIEFSTRFTGTEFVYASNEQRKRDVCLGYDADCNAFTGNVTLPGSPATPTVTVRDYDINGNELASVTVTIPAGGSQGSVRLAGLDYYLHEAAGELPAWFVKNKWHQLVYVSYSGGLAPGGTNCTPGTDCLTLSVQRPWGTETNNDIEALLVMNAGGQLAAQNRSVAGMAGYFENTNAINDLSFQRSNISNTFNDQISVAVP